MNRRIRRGAALAAAVNAAAVLLLGVSPIAAQDGDSPQHWNVTYHAGAAPFPPESKILAAIEGDRVLLQTKKRPQFVIPGREITGVSSSVRGSYGAVSRAEAKFADSLSNPDCIGDYNPCVFVVVAATLFILPSYPIKTTDRLVRITWHEKNIDEEIVLKLNKSDYDSFLAQLEQATGKPLKDLDAEWLKVQAELKREEPNKIEIRLDRKVRIAKSDLEPGTYQVVLLERSAKRGEAYFFPGDEVSAEYLVAVAPVEIGQLANGSTTKVEYKQGANRLASISTISSASKELRFP
jgi:hypothetical protein